MSESSSGDSPRKFLLGCFLLAVCGLVGTTVTLVGTILVLLLIGWVLSVLGIQP